MPTTRRPVTTTTRRPTPTTTAPPATTTTQVPDNEDQGCTADWACDEIESGIDNGYLPEDYDPEEESEAVDLVKILKAFGEHNPDFDADSATKTLPAEGLVTRGQMLIAIAAGLGIEFDPDDDPFEVADELADLGILKGHDRDGDGVANPYTRPDADPDSTMDNEQLAAFLARILPEDDDEDGPTPRKPADPRKPDDPRKPGDPRRPDDPNPPDEDAAPCTTGLSLSTSERSLLVSQLQWATLVGIEPQGESGRPWPPHPNVPGGAQHLVVSGSPVWPVADPQGVWYVDSHDGCLWEVVSVETRLTQLLPWRAGHRATIENADSARPDADLATYLRRWDNLSAAQQTQAQQHHTSRNVKASCGIETAKASAHSYDDCRWELPAPGVWSWQARACFEGIGNDKTFHQCVTLASGVEWFLEIVDYTSGITLQQGTATPVPAA